ncbi:hypothetical protein [Burkholderia sp. S-53]|uniref:hypothetical protein n=1 Tax=Burkholderia sp. S-53 TaxID=2906514 RepID=UPI0021CF5464|nr:hypothetical protein [Burkholderia sp. S-53]UXU89645.1 hypothetical protein LXM88_30310 [Burkholderia sp. S-53]
MLADYNVARFFADAEALYSYEGTYQMQNLIVGKAITGFSAFICDHKRAGAPFADSRPVRRDKHVIDNDDARIIEISSA